MYRPARPRSFRRGARGVEQRRRVQQRAADVAVAVRKLAPEAGTVVGMSLGGLTLLALADQAPELVRSAVLVDVTPGVDEAKSGHIAAFIDGPESFESFDDLLARTIEFNPTRLSSRCVGASCTMPSSAPTGRGSGVMRVFAATKPAAAVTVRRGFGDLWMRCLSWRPVDARSWDA